MTLIFILIVGLTIFFVTQPLLQKNDQSDILLQETSHPVQSLEKQKETLLQSIRELDFDFETGKVSANDYKEMRGKIEAQTVTVMKDLEKATLAWEKMEASL